MEPCDLHSIPMSEIQPLLFLGSYHDALHESSHFDILISALSVPEYRMLEVEAPQHVEWHKLILEDTEEEEIGKYFTLVSTIIRIGLRDGKRILVHCAAGKSRSPTLVMAHLMMEHEWTRREAYEYVSRKRMIIEPNEGFMSQLKSLEYRVLPKESESQEE
jgi:protein-tyrosine phosphatase